MLRGMDQDLSWDHAAEQYEEVLLAAKYQWVSTAGCRSTSVCGGFGREAGAGRGASLEGGRAEWGGMEGGRWHRMWQQDAEGWLARCLQ